jgi:hypothetical protein
MKDLISKNAYLPADGLFLIVRLYDSKLDAAPTMSIAAIQSPPNNHANERAQHA